MARHSGASPAGRSGESLLDLTLRSAVRDAQTVTPAGEVLRTPIEGVTSRPAVTHVDARGSVVEVFDPRWNWHPDPLVFAYCFTIRPGYVKGWNLHKLHEDRYFILQGEMELVLYDVRPGSSTYGRVDRIVLTENNRRLVNVPRNVWHADHNFGTRDVVVINFPTTPYDHANPDKYRLPIDSPLIPYKFPGARGW
jgi:dTDP-4-dehydrorhamnose 3,5-epimerase